ncbi:MAG: SEFIR domain-containing protein [Actinoplanes sp.]
MTQPRRVLLSYAHTTDHHGEAVALLWRVLRAAGVDARLDLTAAPERQEWVAEQLRRAHFILVIASAEYRHRADGWAAPSQGPGVQFEGALLRERYRDDRASWSRRILPVILPGESWAGIPEFLGPATSTTYPVDEVSARGVEALLRVITADPPIGAVPYLPQRTGPPPVRAPAPVVAPAVELKTLVEALGRLPEMSARPSREQVLRLLPPAIRTHVEDAPTAHLHLIGIVQGCARFRSAGRAALLGVLQAVLPDGDPDATEAIGLIRAARLFD